MFNIEYDDSAVRLHFDAMPAKVHKSVKTAIGALAQKLHSHILNDKLKGQVLNRVSGALGYSGFYEVDETAEGITGTVSFGKNVPYGKIHEYGAVFDRLVTMAWGRPVKEPMMHTFHYPERSFARSGLADQREDIVNSLREAVARGIQ